MTVRPLPLAALFVLAPALAVCPQVNVPIGTVIGIAILLYLVRASKAGLFSNATPAA